MTTASRATDRPEARRVRFELTPEQRNYLRAAREEELANRHLASAELRSTVAAAEEPTFSAKLRNAIHRAPMLLDDLCQRANVDIVVLGDFLRGETALDSSCIDRLISVIGWEAIQSAESPTVRAKRSS